MDCLKCILRNAFLGATIIIQMYSAVLQTGGLAGSIPTLYGLLPSYMRCIVEWNVIISACDCTFEIEIYCQFAF